MAAGGPALLHLLHARIVIEPGGNWRVELAHRDQRPVVDRVPAASASEVVAEVEQALAPAAGVAIPGRDARRSRAEERAGRALGRLFAGEVRSQLAWHLGHASGAGDPAVLLIDAPQPEVRRLPWELLALDDGSPLEVSGQARIARLGRGQPQPHRELQLRIGAWVSDGDDASCAGRISDLRAVAREAGLVLDESPGPPADVLHVVCHGRRIDAQVSLLAGARELATASAGHTLAARVIGTPLVVLDVCEGGSVQDAELDTLGGRLLEVGAGAVIAPAGRVSVEASRAFCNALYPALAEGAGVADAVAEGRRAVRALALPHPDSRWANFLLLTSSGAALEPLAAASWRPAGWPTLGPDARDWLERARHRAEPHGFVGLEHLVVALEGLRGAGPVLSQVRFAVKESGPEALDAVDKLQRVVGVEPDWTGTARLQALAGEVSAGAGVEQILERLWTVGALHAILPLRRQTLATHSVPDHTLDPAGSVVQSERPAPATRLEVTGGPEDGRLLEPEPGAWIGRAADAGAAEVVLYAGTPVSDRFLSRRALRWEAAGRVVPSRGEVVDLLDGETLSLTVCTRVRGRA